MKKNSANIILVGYRATGKSSVGRLLADLLSFSFIDMDQELVKQFGPINEMVATHGWPLFREREKTLLKVLLQQKNTIISIGGGAVLHQDIWPQFKKSGLVVWLTASVATISKRLLGDEATAGQRPSLTGKQVTTEIQEVLAKRQPLYAQSCHLKLATDNAFAEQLATMIYEEFIQHYGR